MSKRMPGPTCYECQIIHTKHGLFERLILCPMHAAAPEMYELLDTYANRETNDPLVADARILLARIEGE